MCFAIDGQFHCLTLEGTILFLIFVCLALAVGIQLVIDATHPLSLDDLEHRTDSIEHDAARTRELVDRLNRTAREADAHLKAFAADGGSRRGDPRHD